MDQSLEESGQVINFSVVGDTEHICEASGKIADFAGKIGWIPGRSCALA